MNANNLIEATREDLIAFGDEMMTSSGVRAVSAWLAMSEPGHATYDLEDDEAPYELRSVVGTDIGWEAAQEGLDPNGDIPRYVVYMRLHAAYDMDWLIPALLDYLQIVKGVEPESATASVDTILRLAKARYMDVRDSLPSEDELEETAA